MTDPHVDYLLYRLQTDGSVEYQGAPPVAHETTHFKVRLADNELRIDLLEHHATAETARRRVEPYLASWQVAECLRQQRPAIRFQYLSAEVIDLCPSDPNVVVMEFRTVVACGVDIRMVSVRNDYPKPPDGFTASEDVLLMWGRFEQAERGQEPLLSAAYACLTVLETAAAPDGKKKREAASRKFNIDRPVLDQLGDITSTYGGRSEARKFAADAKRIALTEKQKNWVRAALLSIIQRRGEYDFDPSHSLPPITMSSLPEL